VSHVADGRGDSFILIFYEVIELFVGGIGARDKIIFVEIGVVGTGCSYIIFYRNH